MKAFIRTILYQPLLNLLVFIVWLVPGHNVAMSIIILTLIIRLILLPSSNKATEAQKKMQEMQPELDKIKEKYKNDQQAQAKATMEFYQVNKINPLSSCLPLLIQFPILIVLYYVFRYGLDPSHYNLIYSFVPRPEYMNMYFFGINVMEPNIYLAILTGLAQFWQSKQLMPKKTAAPTNDKSSQFQKILTSQMTYIMPIFTVFIAMALPAALSLYWTVTSLFSVAQQYYVLKRPSKLEKIKITIRQKE
jgi:YidC/Oxa1 family membrane protein insertase